MRNKGIWFAVGCYVIWGVFPIYWKMLQAVPAMQIVAHRLVWSVVFVALLLTISRQWQGLKKVFNLRMFVLYLLSGALLTVNWLVYIYGVNAGFVVETSLGYFINPLVSVLFGVVIFHERLPLTKWIAIGLAALGVVYLTVSYGALPWIALTLAVSFGLYGLVKKLSPLNALHGLSLETAAMFLPSLGYLMFVQAQGTGVFGQVGPGTLFLILFSGVVTAIPLLLFASAAHEIPLSMIGFLQYIAPTLQFLLGVFAYGESFNRERLVGFGIIWLALLLFSVGGFYERRKAMAAAACS
jgi:chloramphenicol-sensitive protein RarD